MGGGAGQREGLHPAQGQVLGKAGQEGVRMRLPGVTRARLGSERGWRGRLASRAAPSLAARVA
jgi:hypothetical protein